MGIVSKLMSVITQVARALLRVLAGLAALFLLGIAALWWWSTPPSDSSLERQFFSHQADITHLLVMMNQDMRMTRVATDFLWTDDNLGWPRPASEWGISQARWGQYRALFDRAGIGEGATRREHSCDLMLGVWGFGTVVDSEYASFLHCGDPDARYQHTEPPCIERKAAGSGADKYHHYRYKRLTDDWYIYQEVW